MKKLLSLVVVGCLILLLSSCSALTEYIESVRPVTHAPALTTNESAFVEMLPELKNASISITNSGTFNGESDTRKGSGVIVKKVEGTTQTTYYAITTQYVVEGALTLTIYVSPTESVSGVVLNAKLTYEADEDIALIRFTTSKVLSVVELKTIDLSRSLDNLTIFSIATPISNGYYNYVTNPALIMGVYGNRIVHGTNLNPGTLGSPLYLKSTGELVGINVKYSYTSGGRPEVLLNEAIHINKVIELIEGYLS
ncbi:MAG: serine protease [Acholeplasma sp.]